MAQFLRPDSDVTAASSGTFADIDESVASDSDFVTISGGATAEYGLSNPSGVPGSGTTTVRYRSALGGSGAASTITCHVYQGTTLIASDSARSPSATFTTYSFTPNMASVTDWNDLRLRFVVSSGRSLSVSWAELEAPDGGVTGTLAATESGSDTFAGTGTTGIGGDLAATETGSDTFAAVGELGEQPITGAMAAVETGADVFAATYPTPNLLARNRRRRVPGYTDRSGGPLRGSYR